MSGVTKHIYEHEMIDVQRMWKNEIESIENVLDKEYAEEDIIELLKKYYPHEWKSVEFKYQYYTKKDKFLIRHSKKARYKMPKPEKLLLSNMTFRKVMSDKYKIQHKQQFNEESRIQAEKELAKKRLPKITKVDLKIQKALEKTQQVEPEFLDKLLGLYERKNTSQKDRMYILAELKKYYSPKIINFFLKLNDTELNSQLRWEAFYHLQSFNYQPRARSQKHMHPQTNNKKRKKYLRDEYSKQETDIIESPEELEYRIENSKEQKIKVFDYFISHSSKDREDVQNLIYAENKEGKNIFCDWINDVDYLKRHLLCHATLSVIEKRLEQSKAVIFVVSKNSINSVWCKYELNYFYNLNKPIYTISVENIRKGVYKITPLTDTWFIDPNYKELALLEGAGIGNIKLESVAI